MNTANKLEHLNPGPAVPFYMLETEARRKNGECGALVVNGNISNPGIGSGRCPRRPSLYVAGNLIVVPRPMPAAQHRYLAVFPRPFPAAPLGVRRRHLIVAPTPLPAASLVDCRRYLAVVPRPLPAAPLVVRRRNVIVVSSPLPGAPRRCRSR
jgi:hypothetical protein